MFNWETPAQGDLNTVAFSVNTPPPNGLIVTPHSPALSFSPAQLEFSPTVSSLQLSYEPTACGPIQVDWIVSGTDADWYDALSLEDYEVTIPCIEVSIDASLGGVIPGVPSNGRVYIEAPADISVTPSAPGRLLSLLLCMCFYINFNF